MLKITYGPAVSDVSLPGPFVDGFEAAFRVKNPDFDASHDDPDEVNTHIDFFDREESKLPTGLVSVAQEWARKNKVDCTLVGFPFNPEEGWLDGAPQVSASVVPGIVLRDYQIDAVRRCLQYGRGVIEIATGGGKSEVAIGVTLALGKPSTIFMVPDRAALYQMRDRFLARGFDESDVGRLGDNLYEVDRPVLVAVVNSLYSGIVNRDEKVVERLDEAEVFFADEVHHQATAMMWKTVALQCKAPRRFGLSGTPYKSIKSRFSPCYLHPYDSWLTGLLGPTLVYIPANKLQSEGKLANCVMRVFPAGGHPVVTTAPQNKFAARAIWQKVYRQGVVENEERNERVALLAANLSDQGRVPLISVEQLDHGRELQRKLYGMDVSSVCSYGSGVLYVPTVFAEAHDYDYEPAPIYEKKKKRGKKTEKEVVGYEEDFCLVDGIDVRKHLEDRTLRVLIGSRVYDEALDIPCLTDLINASGGKAPQRFRQKVGRVLRLFEGKGRACVWDPLDEAHDYLYNHSKQRAKTAASQGFPVVTDWRFYEHMFSVRVAYLDIGDVFMKETELEITIDLTIPVGKAGSFEFVKPRVSLRAQLDESDDIQEVAERLSARAKAVFMVEACKQAQSLGEIKKKGFVAMAKEYLKRFEGSDSTKG